MKITRHAAPDMRQALKAVRDQLGPDAVILASRRTESGVEVTAAMDFDAEGLQAQAIPAPSPPQPVAQAGTPSVVALESELKSLRQMLETQFAQFAWKDLSRRAPIHAAMLRELTEVGLARDLAVEFVSAVPAGTELTNARRLTIAGMAQRLLVTGDRWLDAGGRIAFVGPTGVGKSTTLAKLAVRWVLAHGPRELALVSSDSLRLSGHGEMHSLGQLLGAPVYTLDQYEDLPGLMTRLAHHRLVLIDTPGSSQRDTHLARRLAALAANGLEIETALVLAANAQAGSVAEVVARFCPASPASCVLTKVDEAASLGGTLSVLMRSRLPVSYVSEGQRVPEDLRPARALELITSAVQLAAATGAVADEELLKRRFGGLAHAFA